MRTIAYEVFTHFEGNFRITPEGSAESLLAFVENASLQKSFILRPELGVNILNSIAGCKTSINIGKLWYDGGLKEVFEGKKACSIEFEYINEDGREDTETITNVLFNEYGKESSDSNVTIRESIRGESIVYYYT